MLYEIEPRAGLHGPRCGQDGSGVNAPGPSAFVLVCTRGWCAWAARVVKRRAESLRRPYSAITLRGLRAPEFSFWLTSEVLTIGVVRRGIAALPPPLAPPVGRSGRAPQGRRRAIALSGPSNACLAPEVQWKATSAPVRKTPWGRNPDPRLG